MKKKILAAIAAAIVIASSVTTLSSASKSAKLGDVNLDGVITAADARLALRMSASLEPLDEFKILVADMDKNGMVYANDARTILRISARLEEDPNETVTMTDPTSVSPEEPSSALPDEPSSSLPDEPSSEITSEPTTESTLPYTGEYTSDYPDAIKGFLTGSYTLEGTFTFSDGLVSDLRLISDGSAVALKLGDSEVTVVVSDEQIYTKYELNGTKYYIDNTALEAFGFDPVKYGFTPDNLLKGFVFGSPEELGNPLEFIGAQETTYTFKKSDGGEIVFTVTDGLVTSITSTQADGSLAATVSVSELSADIPLDALTITGCELGKISDMLSLV